LSKALLLLFSTNEPNSALSKALLPFFSTIDPSLALSKALSKALLALFSHHSSDFHRLSETFIYS
ncbi:hypothetical protein, partial [Paenibacillus odorifer]|uniref:hypothetical protein n=1 Tax=Paenibacillus odorifer TaxID=189426 RepID=UPI001C4C8D7A